MCGRSAKPAHGHLLAGITVNLAEEQDSAWAVPPAFTEPQGFDINTCLRLWQETQAELCFFI